VKVNIDRLMKDIERYSEFGKTTDGGVTRPSFSHADIELRKMFIDELKKLGLSVTIDGAANIWGKRKGVGNNLGSIVIGSHLDSVPNGGWYDGTLGVLMAKEIMRTLTENDVFLDHDIEIVSFTAEESNEFNLSTFGSRSFVGCLSADKISGVHNSKGKWLSEELEKVGGGLREFPKMKELRKKIKAFIELHIEQGQRLEDKNISMAIVDQVAGIYRSNVKVIGESNHSGTTMMDKRKDALTAAAEMILEIEYLCKECMNGVVGTVGRLDVYPNATNIIPGEINFNFEVRGCTEELIKNRVNKIQEKFNDIANKRKIELKQEVFLDQKPVDLDKDILSILQSTAVEMDEPYTILPSMAVHDAAHMASITKSSMVFVKSIGGKSHCPEELSLHSDIEKSGNLILQGIIKLDNALTKQTI